MSRHLSPARTAALLSPRRIWCTQRDVDVVGRVRAQCLTNEKGESLINVLDSINSPSSLYLISVKLELAIGRRSRSCVREGGP